MDVVHDPQQQRAEREQQASTSVDARATSQSTAPSSAAAVAVAPERALPGREEPPCLRNHLLAMLDLPVDLPAHFIGEKTVRPADLAGHQNRFLLPADGGSRLREILAADELDPEDVAADAEAGTTKKRKRGDDHDRLPVKVVDHCVGAMVLRLWWRGRGGGTAITGPGYHDFIRRCSFKENDVVEVWAFKQRGPRNSGSSSSDMGKESHLHVLIIKKDLQTKQCSHCTVPS